jgi:hypothetical protein
LELGGGLLAHQADHMTPANRFNLTGRDQDILETLTLRVRTLSAAQIADHWFGGQIDSVGSANRRLKQLEIAGLLHRLEMFARPLPKLNQPMTRWVPGDAEPELGNLSYQLVKRWNRPASMTRICIATKTAGTLCGGHGGRRPRNSEASHDLGLASVFLRHIANNAQAAANWLSEESLRYRGFGDHMRLPDAMVEDDRGSTIIEFGGAYSAQKLRDFHGFCQREGLAYEIW